MNFMVLNQYSLVADDFTDLQPFPISTRIENISVH